MDFVQMLEPRNVYRVFVGNNGDGAVLLK